MAKKAKYVYVITKGQYSDYHICAVTMDKDRAERMRKLYNGDWAMQISRRILWMKL